MMTMTTDRGGASAPLEHTTPADRLAGLIANYVHHRDALNNAPVKIAHAQSEALTDAYLRKVEEVGAYQPTNADEFLRKMAIVFEDGDPVTERVCTRVWQDIVHLLGKGA